MDFVDFDEDLKYKDLINGIADGFDNVELLKRYSTVGMGPSQGKHSAVAAVRIVARETGESLEPHERRPPQRPPYTPEKFGHMAGRVFEPERRTAMHHRHLELGAQMMPAGLWWRPAYYGQKSERDQAIRDEVNAVRNNVGLIDVSTLGGLDVRGPDAAEFLNRMYTFAYAKQQVGRCRYVLMTDKAGVVTDDGVAVPVPRRAFLRDGHDQRRRRGLSPDAVVERAMAARRRRRQRHRRLCRREHRRAEVARGAGARVRGRRSLAPQAFPYMGVRDGGRSPAFRRASCGSASSASLATKSMCRRARAKRCGMR